MQLHYSTTIINAILAKQLMIGTFGRQCEVKDSFKAEIPLHDCRQVESNIQNGFPDNHATCTAVSQPKNLKPLTVSMAALKTAYEWFASIHPTIT